MAVDINELSAKELDSLITKAKRRKTALAKRKPIATVRAKLRAQAKAEGYTLEELFGGTATRKTRRFPMPTGGERQRILRNSRTKWLYPQTSVIAVAAIWVSKTVPTDRNRCRVARTSMAAKSASLSAISRP